MFIPCRVPSVWDVGSLARKAVSLDGYVVTGNQPAFNKSPGLPNVGLQAGGN
jgi:hypothetical protein